MSAAPRPVAETGFAARLWRIASLVRYRFFLYAGLLPYLLGAAWAWAIAGAFDTAAFWSAFGGVVLSVIGVEAFNEYFDARMGTDRVFNPEDIPPIAQAVFWIGTVAFAGALAVGVYLAWHIGWPIIVFALLGGAAAIFYEAPPIRWSYRGLGELVIALSYGPWMVLGSLYLHTRSVSWEAFAASLVPACFIMALAVVNAIPDFHQDRLVGKRNLVVRFGREPAVRLYLGLAIAGLAIVLIGVVAKMFPVGCLAALLAAPLVVTSARTSLRHHSAPREFLPAMRAMVLAYLVATGGFALGIVAQAVR
ncbi:prenyltransferase [Usitatibacter palustris]|uniref:1,4-dihydroxy-2-naphthoate octaprenyltransferase n=1 Tax=Usitatibacter palustris TaxID=2732487 RepID=A0A6M4HA87_9PROT|nr:prenyltransferase [Usitatibacter palustris]QJR15613.1 1,4-dihydroxy-2-naphthoate octaprenyltransferase [Usitatibacter palustris]